MSGYLWKQSAVWVDQNWWDSFALAKYSSTIGDILKKWPEFLKIKKGCRHVLEVGKKVSVEKISGFSQHSRTVGMCGNFWSSSKFVVKCREVPMIDVSCQYLSNIEGK